MGRTSMCGCVSNCSMMDEPFFVEINLITALAGEIESNSLTHLELGSPHWRPTNLRLGSPSRICPKGALRN